KHAMEYSCSRSAEAALHSCSHDTGSCGRERRNDSAASDGSLHGSYTANAGAEGAALRCSLLNDTAKKLPAASARRMGRDAGKAPEAASAGFAAATAGCAPKENAEAAIWGTRATVDDGSANGFVRECRTCRVRMSLAMRSRSNRSAAMCASVPG